MLNEIHCLFRASYMAVQKVHAYCKCCFKFVPLITGFHRPLRLGGTPDGLHPPAARGSDAASVGAHGADPRGCWTLASCARVPLCHLLQDPQQCLAARYRLWSCQPTPTGSVKNYHFNQPFKKLVVFFKYWRRVVCCDIFVIRFYFKPIIPKSDK